MKLLKEFAPFLQLDPSEQPIFFEKTNTLAPSGKLAGLIPPNYHLLLTNRRIVLIATDKRKAKYEEAYSLDEVSGITVKKGFLNHSLSFNCHGRTVKVQFISAAVKFDALQAMEKVISSSRGSAESSASLSKSALPDPGAAVQSVNAAPETEAASERTESKPSAAEAMPTSPHKTIQGVPSAGKPARWYVSAGGKAVGPYTGEQMKKCVSEGKVKAASKVCLAGVKEWVRLDTAMPELFKDAQEPPPPPPGDASLPVVGETSEEPQATAGEATATPEGQARPVARRSPFSKPRAPAPDKEKKAGKSAAEDELLAKMGINVTQGKKGDKKIPVLGCGGCLMVLLVLAGLGYLFKGCDRKIVVKDGVAEVTVTANVPFGALAVYEALGAVYEAAKTKGVTAIGLNIIVSKEGLQDSYGNPLKEDLLVGVMFFDDEVAEIRKYRDEDAYALNDAVRAAFKEKIREKRGSKFIFDY